MTTTESHTPIAVPCEELELILDALGQGTDLPGDVVRAIERVRGRFPASWGIGIGDPYSQYEERVPSNLRGHAEALMTRWRSDGRNDTEIEHIVRSLVLAAYAWEQRRLEHD